jgi:uncharacterized membrane protein
MVRKIKKNFLIALLINFIIIFAFLNFLLYSTPFHSSLIKRYSDNPYHLEIDKNVTKYITGFSNELNVDFDENEKSHMADVKRLVLIEEFIFIALLIGFFILIYKRKIYYTCFKKASLILFLTALLSLIVSVFFNSFFILFHFVFFPQWNWEFPASSLMIQVYQQSFFLNFFIITIIASLFITVFIHFIVAIKRKI